ncbi:DUF397 domain-containing protein [Streptomyces asoensis]|uniref:DUF397 domain-containing protein n=1 Tax=Streptomyces asoensis TaxID=249586 RepID=UPI0034023F15
MNAAGSGSVATEPAWFKSSYSGAEGGQCLEVASTGEAVLVRDSKQADGSVLAVGVDAWAGFVRLAVGR